MINLGIIIIIITLTAVITVCCINWYIIYDYYKSHCDGIISFDRFLEIYEYSNDKIYLADNYFSYEHYSESDFCVKTYNFYFSVPDTFRYERWRKKIKRKEEKERSDAVMEKVEKLWAKDAVDTLWKRSIDNREQEKENGN